MPTVSKGRHFIARMFVNANRTSAFLANAVISQKLESCLFKSLLYRRAKTYAAHVARSRNYEWFCVPRRPFRRASLASSSARHGPCGIERAKFPYGDCDGRFAQNATAPATGSIRTGDTLIYDLKFRFHCEQCRAFKDFEIKIVDMRNMGDNSKPCPERVIGVRSR